MPAAPNHSRGYSRGSTVGCLQITQWLILKLTAITGLSFGVSSLMGLSATTITPPVNPAYVVPENPVPLVVVEETVSAIIDGAVLQSDGSTKAFKKPQRLENQAVRYKDGSSYVSVESHVREYFSDIPIMIEVARCESQFRHSSVDGNVLRGYVNKSDRGVMQINTYYHGETADRMDIDVLQLEGNLEYARYLYNRDGTQPWISSSPCWGKAELAKK